MRAKLFTLFLLLLCVLLISVVRFSPIGDAVVRTAERSYLFFLRTTTASTSTNSGISHEEVYSCLVEQQAQLARLDVAETTITELRSILHFVSSTKPKSIGADIVGSPLDVLHTGVYINRGYADQVSLGDAVVIREGVLFGLVTEVSENRSFVRLVTDPRSKFTATVFNKEKSKGIVEGGFGVALGLVNVPQHEMLSVGDLVYTSTLSETIPAGIIIGRIVAVEKEPYEPFQRAVIEPYTNLLSAAYVIVLLQKSAYTL